MQAKEHGRFGHQKVRSMKLLWKIIKQPDNVWVRLIKAKYLHETNVLEYTKKGNCSQQWSKFMDLRNTPVKGLWWQIGDGVSIRKDKWLYQKSLLEIGAFNHQLQVINIDAKVNDLLNNQGEWNFNILNQILPPNIVDDISCLHIPLNKTKDNLFWGYSANEDSHLVSTRLTR